MLPNCHWSMSCYSRTILTDCALSNYKIFKFDIKSRYDIYNIYRFIQVCELLLFYNSILFSPPTVSISISNGRLEKHLLYSKIHSKLKTI